MEKQIWKIIGIIAVIGFSMICCDNGNDNSGDGLTITVQATNGKLTITGLNAYNNNYVIATGSGYDINYENSVSFQAAGNINSNATYTGGNVSSGQTTLNVWRMINSSTIGNYNGNHEAYFIVIISNKANISRDDMLAWQDYLMFDHAKPAWLVEMGYVDVDNFTGGIGSGVFELDTDY